MKLERRQIIGLVVLGVLILILLYMIIFLDAYKTTFSPQEQGPVLFEPSPTQHVMKEGNPATVGDLAQFGVQEGSTIQIMSTSDAATITVLTIAPDKLSYTSTANPDKVTFVTLQGAEPLDLEDMQIAVGYDKYNGPNNAVMILIAQPPRPTAS